MHVADELRVRIDDAIDEAPAALVIDLSGVTFLDSMALGVLLGGLKRDRRGGRPAACRDLAAGDSEDFRGHAAGSALRPGLEPRRSARCDYVSGVTEACSTVSCTGSIISTEAISSTRRIPWSLVTSATSPPADSAARAVPTRALTADESRNVHPERSMTMRLRRSAPCEHLLELRARGHVEVSVDSHDRRVSVRRRFDAHLEVSGSGHRGESR